MSRYHTAKDNYTAELDSEFQKSQEPFHETDLNKLHLQVLQFFHGNDNDMV